MKTISRNKEVISVNIPPPKIEAIDTLAKEKGVSRSELIRWIVFDFLEAKNG